MLPILAVGVCLLLGATLSAQNSAARQDSRASRHALEQGIQLEEAGSLEQAYKAYGEAVSLNAAGRRAQETWMVGAHAWQAADLP